MNLCFQKWDHLLKVTEDQGLGTHLQTQEGGSPYSKTKSQKIKGWGPSFKHRKGAVPTVKQSHWRSRAGDPSSNTGRGQSLQQNKVTEDQGLGTRLQTQEGGSPYSKTKSLKIKGWGPSFKHRKGAVPTAKQSHWRSRAGDPASNTGRGQSLQQNKVTEDQGLGTHLQTQEGGSPYSKTKSLKIKGWGPIFKHRKESLQQNKVTEDQGLGTVFKHRKESLQQNKVTEDQGLGTHLQTQEGGSPYSKTKSLKIKGWGRSFKHRKGAVPTAKQSHWRSRAGDPSSNTGRGQSLQ